MTHSFDDLRGEYTALLSSMVVTRVQETNATAARLLKYKPRYLNVASATGVPILLLAALHNRESDANFNTYLGNGEPLSRVTRLVPKGRGPFSSWEAGAKDGLHVDLLDQVSDWSWPKALYYGELWNGFGPRDYHGIHTGYLWAGTNHYTCGKYVADGKWDGAYVDTQLGIVPVMKRMVEVDPSLDLPADSTPAASSPPDLTVAQIQHALNIAGEGPLDEDGSLGMKTRAVIKAFQSAHGLVADGLVGPLTRQALVETTTRGA
jgi:lysozyme family protein